MKDILAAADEHLRFSGDDGRDYRLSSAYLDEGAFLSLDDRVLYLVTIFDFANLCTTVTAFCLFVLRYASPRILVWQRPARRCEIWRSGNCCVSFTPPFWTTLKTRLIKASKQTHFCLDEELFCFRCLRRMKSEAELLSFASI